MTAAIREVPSAGAPVGELFEYVYARYCGRITRLIARWLRDWDTAEDLAAEMFTTLWRDMSQRGFELVDPQHAYSLLAQRAKWTAFGHFKSAAKRHEQPSEQIDAERSRIGALAAALTSDGPETTVVSHADLTGVIAILPDEQQRAILLRYLLEMSPDQVASFTGWPPSAVSYYTASALSALRSTEGVSEALGLTPIGRRRNGTTGAASSSPEVAARRSRAESLILDRVYGGELSLGELLPSVRAMAAWCQLPRTAMHELLTELTERGVLVQDAVGRYHVAPAEPSAPQTTMREQAAEQLREHVTELLASGQLTPGAMLPSQAQLAARLGWRETTIFRALGVLKARRLLVQNRAGRYLVAPALAGVA
jgi:RNA polymerase sigma factor (sigma-70 family)